VNKRPGVGFPTGAFPTVPPCAALPSLCLCDAWLVWSGVGFQNHLHLKNCFSPVLSKTVKIKKWSVFDIKFNFQNLGKENQKPSVFSDLSTCFGHFLFKIQNLNEKH
jgi:hypothetical protein